ncbi:MAG: hypothetical protein HFH79_09455 [Lachnospiraceae bacterium]|jgi:hypothetical protein|nr:hypothetical protein C804_01895 [Lachnospiraceae bacterium A4]MCI8266148.1 hypothetical protein [Lachnospiraceae bacterium]MCI8973800.1 hypothetical protein [Lachnospiraceae bacterium]
MDEKSMIDDLVSQLDAGFSGEKAVGHFNVDVSEDASTKEVQTLGCTDCSSNPMACSVPTLHEGLDHE